MGRLLLRRGLAAFGAAAAALAGGVAVAAPAGADGATLTITVSSPRQVQTPLTVSGTLTSAGQPVPNAMVSLSRTDPNAQPTLQATGATGQDGSYSLGDSPDVRGQVTYTVTATDPSDPNGVTSQATVTVAGIPASLTVRADHSVIRSGRLAHLTVHLGAGPTNRHVTLYATPYHRNRDEVVAGDVDATSGDLTASYRMDRRTTFHAVFAGDSQYAPATSRLVVRARGVLGERLSGGYGRSGSYRLYRVGSSPKLTAALTPSLHRVCLRFRAQRRSHSRWHTSALSSCIHTNSRGESAGDLIPPHVAGTPYRVRAEWRGNRTALACKGRWLKLKFHR